MITVDIAKELKSQSNTMMLDVTMQIEEGAFIAVAGESGSGKTTLLRILAGLETSKGSIKIGSDVWQSERFFLPPQKRAIGFVFQNYALFENMTVEQNLLYVRKDRELAQHLLELTSLLDLAKRYPNSLSGGQKQRVALCRAFMRRPKLLLLDEPLSALDPQMRIKLQQDIMRLHKEFGTTSIMVSHDPSEIYRLASYVYMLQNGRIIQEGSPKEVLLKMQGSQKFSFEGEILDIFKADVIFVAVVAIGQQIVEVVLGSMEAERLRIGQKVAVSAKAFAPLIRPLD